MHNRLMLFFLSLLLVSMPPAAAAATDSAGKNNSELAGTAWQLVKIMSMDDTTYEPRERPLYRLEFGQDGDVSILADCNRGMGSWTSEAPGRLEFGPIASTRALCLPESISEKYLAQFEWVRSYTMKDGHLFLATMADGSIIEFEPLDVPAVATVYGEQIRTDDAAEMQDVILTRLFDRYAAEHGIEVTEEEIDKWITAMDRAMAADGLTESHHLTPEEAEEYRKMRHDMGLSIIEHWKLNRALYKQYGGRIIFQQFGPEPLDAYREFLEERQKSGAFSIEDPDFKEHFWHYFTDDSIHSFMEKGSEEMSAVFETPPWEQLGDFEASDH